MRNSWARAFLETLADFVGEDTTMTDPMFYPNAWRRARELDAETARLNALMALSAATDAEREQQAKRRRAAEALSDEYYGAFVLLDNGICPECLWPVDSCECNPSIESTEDYGECEDDADGR